MKKSINIIYCFIVFFLSIILTFSFLEFMVRKTNLVRPENFFNIYENDPSLGWRLKRSLDVNLSTMEYSMRLVTNRRGFRDDEHLFEKSPRVKRIIGLGDSFLFGCGVEKPKDVLSRLGKLLKRGGGKNIETINFGIPGYNINQYYKLLESDVFNYNADIIIVFFYLNDFREGGEFDYAGVNQKGFLISRNNQSFIVTTLKSYSYLYFYMKVRIKYIMQRLSIATLPPNIEIFRTNFDYNAEFKHTFELISKIKKLCDSHKVPLVLVIIPYKQQIDSKYYQEMVNLYKLKASDLNLGHPQECLMNFCENLNIPCIDLMPCLKEENHQKMVYFKMDSHWNEDGHSAAAKCLYDYIRKIQLFN